MSRTWWNISRFPLCHLISDRERNSASIHHDILVVEPVLIPLLAIYLDRLDVISSLAKALWVAVAGDSQSGVRADGHVDVTKPW